MPKTLKSKKADWLDGILNRRLILVTGKGGTGKSSVATGLAFAAESRGKRVLLAELGRADDQEFMRLSELLQMKSLGQKPKRVKTSQGGLYASRLEPQACLIEYLGIKLRSATLAKVILKNRITEAFVRAVPGLSDLVSLGKIWHLLEREKSSELDLVILDAPASGHALNFLYSPRQFARLTRSGPIFGDAAEISDFLADEKKFGIVFVSLPEEVPFTEAMDFAATLGENFPAPQVLVNRSWSLAVPGAQAISPLDLPEGLRENWKFAQARCREEETWFEEHEKNFPACLAIPEFPRTLAGHFPAPEMTDFFGVKQ